MYFSAVNLLLKGGGSAAHLFPFYPRMRLVIPRNATALSGISLPLHRINETIASVFCRFRVGSGSVQGRSRVGALSLKGVLRAKVERGKRESAAALRAGGTLASAPDTLACGHPSKGGECHSVVADRSSHGNSFFVLPVRNHDLILLVFRYFRDWDKTVW